MKIVNIAAYRFAPLTDLRALRARLLALCKGWELKGTILLSVEGINLFVAGKTESIENLLTELRSLPGLADLTPKYSETEHQPFTRMLVRLKKEIIAFGVPGIEPAKRTSPKLKAQELLSATRKGIASCAGELERDYISELEAVLKLVESALATESPSTGAGEVKQLQSACARLDEITKPLADLLMDRALEAMLRKRGAIS